MPTLTDWESALRSPRLVTIESSSQLIADLQHKRTQHDLRLAAQGRQVPQRKPNLTPVTGLPEEILVEPIDLLHRLGVVTTPVVENLADICSWWAYFRYLWAFELPKGATRERLRLSTTALSIDFHQKGLMSDQIGVGMAALLMARLFNAPDAADVAVAIDDPAWPITLTGEASPDYIFSNADQSALYVVECKGTRCSRSDALDQLRRGTEQVPSLVFLDGRPEPSSLVIGTQLSSSSVRVYIIDPPSEDLPSAKNPRRVGSRKRLVPDSRALEHAARQVSQAKFLSYAGSDEAATAKLSRVSPRFGNLLYVTPRQTVTDENEYGSFRGVRQQLPLRDSLRIEVFQALHEALREAYIQNDVDRISDETRRLKTRAGVTREERGASRIIRSLAADGTLLELRLIPP